MNPLDMVLLGAVVCLSAALAFTLALARMGCLPTFGKRSAMRCPTCCRLPAKPVLTLV